MSEAEVKFESYLDPDEEIIWKGRPEPKEKSIREKLKDSEGGIVGWVVALALAYAFAGAGHDFVRSSVFWQSRWFGLGVALIVSALLVLYAAVRSTLGSRRGRISQMKERYAITNKRALCWSEHGKKFLVRSIPIMPGDWIGADLQVPGRTLFSRATIALGDEGEPLPDEDFVSFRDVSDAAEAYRLIRKIQNAHA